MAEKKSLIQQSIDAKCNDVAIRLANAMWKNNCKGKRDFLKKALVEVE